MDRISCRGGRGRDPRPCQRHKTPESPTASVSLARPRQSPRNTHGSHRNHRPQIRQTAPKSIKHLDMTLLQLPRPRSPEPLPGVMLVPDVKVGDLRALGREDAADLPGLDLPRAPASDWHRKGVYLLPGARLGRSIGDRLVEVPVEGDGVVCWGRWLGHGQGFSLVRTWCQCRTVNKSAQVSKVQ